MKYLPRVDRSGILRRSGSVLLLEKVALKRAMEIEYASQQHQKRVAVECSNNWVAHSSRSSRVVESAWKEDKKRGLKGESFERIRGQSCRFWGDR